MIALIIVVVALVCLCVLVVIVIWRLVGEGTESRAEKDSLDEAVLPLEGSIGIGGDGG